MRQPSVWRDVEALEAKLEDVSIRMTVLPCAFLGLVIVIFVHLSEIYPRAAICSFVVVLPSQHERDLQFSLGATQ